MSLFSHEKFSLLEKSSTARRLDDTDKRIYIKSGRGSHRGIVIYTAIIFASPGNGDSWLYIEQIIHKHEKSRAAVV